MALLSSGCYVVRYNTVFPHVTWYWSAAAKQDRLMHKEIQAWEKKNAPATNSPAK